MPLEIKGQLFQIGAVALSEGAKDRAVYMQRRSGAAKAHHGDDMAASVHSSILLELHARGDWGEVGSHDRIVNRNNIKKNTGRVLSVIGERFPFVIITELPSGDTLICTPEEV